MIFVVYLSGAGLTIASQINARMLDIVYAKLKAKNGGVGKPEYRLRKLCLARQVYLFLLTT